MSLKYYLGALVSIPLLPIIYFQGKKIRKKMPKLPEAKEPKGFAEKGSKMALQILTIGESTIAGVGVNKHQDGFTGSLANTLSKTLNTSVNWQVYAKSGYTTKQVGVKIISKITETNVDIIVIGLGGNDAFTLNSPKKFIKDTADLINLLQDKFPKKPIFFANMPPIKEFPAFTKSIKFVIGNLVEIFGEELHLYLKNKSGVYYNNEVITLKTWASKHNTERNKNSFFSDGVHPSKLTYQIWGKEMATFIVSKL